MDIDVTKPKFFQFNVTIEGIDYAELSGKLEFMYENVIYAFPAKIFKERVEVEIPPLQSIIKRNIQETDILTAKLEITGDMFHLPAWNSDMVIKKGLFIESSDPYIDDLPSPNESLTEDKIPSIYDNVLKEDMEFLRKLRNDSENEMVFDKDIRIAVSKQKEETKKSNTSGKTISKNTKSDAILKESFDKRKFLKEATAQEKHAVENNISFDETSKNDSPAQKEFRMKIRNIVQESYIKKLKSAKMLVKKENITPETIVESQEQINITEEFDVNSVNETNISNQSIRLMMESVGMKTSKTQDRMISHAKDKGAKSDIQIFDTIKGMLFPPAPQQGGMQENFNKAMEVFQKSSN